jgi:hypothetical protein
MGAAGVSPEATLGAAEVLLFSGTVDGAVAVGSSPPLRHATSRTAMAEMMHKRSQPDEMRNSFSISWTRRRTRRVGLWVTSAGSRWGLPGRFMRRQG